MNVRELITEACARINLVSRRQAVPGDISQNAYNLLKGIISKYNNADLLVWTQKSVIIPKANVIHIYDETDFVKGEYNYYFDSVDDMNAYELTQDDVDNTAMAMVTDGTYDNVVWTAGVIHYGPDEAEYRWFGHRINEPWTQRVQDMKAYIAMHHMKVRDVARINSIYVISNANEPYREHYPLEYVNHTEFDKYTNTSRVYTYTQKSEGEWVVELKPLFYTGNYRLKFNYNEAMQFDYDSDLFIPDSYLELLIVALAHKLAIMYPRLDEAQMARLEKEVQVLVDNVRTPKAEDRVLTRENYWDGRGRMTQSELMSGQFVF